MKLNTFMYSYINFIYQMAEWLRLLTSKCGDLGSIPAGILFQRYRF